MATLRLASAHNGRMRGSAMRAGASFSLFAPTKKAHSLPLRASAPFLLARTSWGRRWTCLRTAKTPARYERIAGRRVAILHHLMKTWRYKCRWVNKGLAGFDKFEQCVARAQGRRKDDSGWAMGYCCRDLAPTCLLFVTIWRILFLRRACPSDGRTRRVAGSRATFQERLLATCSCALQVLDKACPWASRLASAAAGRAPFENHR